MRKIIFIIFLILFSSAVLVSAEDVVFVATYISGDFQQEIRESVIPKLEGLKGIAVRKNDPDFTISIVSNQVRWDDGTLSSIVPISYIVKSSSGKIWHWLVIGNSRDIGVACSKIVEMIKTNVLRQ